jgi:hypothetical protein
MEKPRTLYDYHSPDSMTDYGDLITRPGQPSINTMDTYRIIDEINAGYDMPGYIDKYGLPDQSGGQHLTDEFKLPNHITFSTDSKYHSDKTPGGKWEKRDGKWHYTPSQFVIDMQGLDRLKWYFENREPNSILHLSGENK